MCGTPCPDCPWSLLVLAGKPQLAVRCTRCRTWRHYALRRDTVRAGVAGAFYAETVLTSTLSQKDINSMLRCDCLAPHLYILHVRSCAMCDDSRRSDTHMTLYPGNTLHMVIMRLRPDVYHRLRLPAYTLQRRCGANPDYYRRYFDMVKAMPDGNIKTLEAAEEWRKKRLAIIEGKGGGERT